MVKPPAPDTGFAAASFSLREARPEDSEAIVNMVQALAAHIGDAALAKVTPSQLSAAAARPDPLWRGIVAEIGGGLVGVCLYSVVFSTWVGAPGLYIIDLYVKPEFRKSRLGQFLLAAAAKAGRGQGCRFIRLDVDARNRGVDEFYTRLGFRERSGDGIFVLEPVSFDALAGESQSAGLSAGNAG